MLFHTWEFGIFFAIVYTGYLLLRRTRYCAGWLFLASYLFYGWWNPVYLCLIIASTFTDYFMVRFITRPRERGWRLYPVCLLPIAASITVTYLAGPPGGRFILWRGWPPTWLLVTAALLPLVPLGLQRVLRTELGLRRLYLVLSLAGNLGMLLYFKYAGFLTTNFNWLSDQFGWAARSPVLDVVLPVGISFFVFQSLTFTLDVYLGKLQPDYNLIRYAAFHSFFPQLVAGPIERASHLLPQFATPRQVTLSGVADGLSLFVVGLFKKIALADFLALYVDHVYGDPASFGGWELLFATYAFAWQIYFDFSAYSDMARGLAMAMGFELMINFNNPYTSSSLQDFWRRWHISLSTWYRDYVYIPLGGNRHGAWRMYRNIIITMVVCGLWHGANWTFVVWGFLHAVGRLGNDLLEKLAPWRALPRLVKVVLVFHFVCWTWVFFRASSVEQAWLITTRIASAAPGICEVPVVLGLLVAAVWLYQLMFESRLRSVLEAAPVRIGLVIAMLLYLMTFVSARHAQFIYFQF
jgi:D-alanyl-lipoteichoic acid acyltransferase DltB (MBOAT superfamily)